MITISELKSRSIADPIYYSLCRLRYNILVQEQSKNVTDLDNERRLVIDKLDATSHIFVALDDDQVIGMIRYTVLESANFALLRKEYALDRLEGKVSFENAFVTTRYLVHPAFRGKRVAFDLVAQGCVHTFYKLGLYYSIVGSTDAIYKFHYRLGYRRYTDEPIIFDEGMSVYPMVLDLREQEYLQSIKSPLRHLIYVAPVNEANEVVH